MRCSSTSWPVNRWAEEVGRRTLRRSVLKSHLLELFRRGDAIGPFTLLKDVFGEFHPFFFGEGVRAGRRDRFFDTRAPSGAHLGYGVLEPRDVLRSLRAFLRNSLRKRPAVPATVLSVLVFDVSIVRPRRSFAVSGTQYLITFGVMRIVELAAVYPGVRRNVS